MTKPPRLSQQFDPVPARLSDLHGADRIAALRARHDARTAAWKRSTDRRNPLLRFLKRLFA